MNLEPRSGDEVLDRVIAAIADTLDQLPPEPLGRDTDLFRDLGLDSIDALTLCDRLEDAYQRTFSPGAFLQVSTVGELAERVSREIGRDDGGLESGR